MAHIAVVGLGKLGAPLLGVLASGGHRVMGADINPDLVNAIRNRAAPVPEPGLAELLGDPGTRVGATTDVREAVDGSDISFIVLPTPSEPSGKFSCAAVADAVRQIGATLKGHTGYHLVVVVSTVMPGDMDAIIRQTLEDSAGRSTGDTLGLCYNPSLVALGNVVAGFQKPDLIIIGESDARAGDMLEGIHRSICTNSPAIRRMSLRNAEIAKIAINSFVTTKISFANMLSEICDRVPGADAAVVTEAVGCDPRIGGKYIRPALGYGGPCFPRDNAAFASFAESLGAGADLAEAADRINRRQVARVCALAQTHLPMGTIAILGMSYKPGTPNCEESQSIMLARALSDAGYRVLISDPAALDLASALLGDRAQPMADAAEAVRSADLAIIATPWPDYSQLPESAFCRPGKKLTVIDCWRLEWLGALSEHINLIYLGQGGPDLARS
ncbi:MAG: nucleotide sugar dehydrogenase [Alphaproteobacteria bacterium]|nr:nucleotide sugar dehydrogenase [Alphaproteobacteria bacterium]